MVRKWSGNEASEVVQNSQYVDQAHIEKQQSNPDRFIQKVTLDLGTARDLGNPFKVNFAYRSVYVPSATDSATEVEYYPNTNETTNASFPLNKNAVLSFDFSVKTAYFTWAAQPGKTMTIIFILFGEFRPGSLFTEVSSAVEGNSITPITAVTATTSSAELVPQNLNRTVLNLTSNADFYISNAGQTIWYPMPANTPINLKNTAQIYVKTLIGTATINILEES